MAAAIVILVATILFYLLYLPGKRGVIGKEGGEVFTVKRGDITDFTEQTGIIKSQVGAIVKVGTRATGTLTYLKYQVGDLVRKGELIAKIDDREIIANISNQKAQIEEQKRDLEAKEAQYAYAKVNYERESRLLEKGFTTKDSVDKARTDFNVACAEVELARAKVKEAVERLKALEITLSYTRIYAPITGYVSSVSTQEGETVVSGLAAAILITVIDPTRLEMWIYVDETDIGRTRPGMNVTYWVDTYRNRQFSGRIEKIYPEPEIKDNIVYYLAIVKVPPEDTAFLRPEMTTHVRIIVEEKKGVLVVPNSAVRFEGGKSVVHLKTGKGLEIRPVKTGIRDDRFTEILSGLSEGEEVVIPGIRVTKTKDGQRQ